MLLIYPPYSKNCEPPAGIAQLAGALQAHNLPCTLCDMNSEGQAYIFSLQSNANDTWTKRALHNKDKNLHALQSPQIYTNIATYRKAVFECNRLLANFGTEHGISLSLANFQDHHLVALRSEDLLLAAEHFEDSAFFPYFSKRLPELIIDLSDNWVGFSLNYLSQATCTFAMIGFLRRYYPKIRIVVGGGLATSWQRSQSWHNPFRQLVDRWVAGRGEEALLSLLAQQETSLTSAAPDYSELRSSFYLAPGFILPFAASSGCFWRKCSFCPETSEMNPFRQAPPQQSLTILHEEVSRYQPVLLHFLDNALSPAFLEALVQQPPGVPWYGFVRFNHDLTRLDYCHALKNAGCVMLKLGLESGCQDVLDALRKGIQLADVSKALNNLFAAGIRTYVYLLFGTPAETCESAHKTLEFTKKHQQTITYLNLAIFNLPVDSPEAEGLVTSSFYQGDLALYHDFEHPTGWNRGKIRQFLDNKWKKDPVIKPILQRDPPFFTSNHAPFFR